MDLSPDSDVVLDVDVLFVGTAGVVPDMPLLENIGDVPFRVSVGHFYLEKKMFYGTATVVKTH